MALLARDQFARGCCPGSLAGAVVAGLLAAVAMRVPTEVVGEAFSWSRGPPVALSAVGWSDPASAWPRRPRLGAFVTFDVVTSSTRATASLVVSAAVLVGGQVSWTLLRRNFTV